MPSEAQFQHEAPSDLGGADPLTRWVGDAQAFPVLGERCFWNHAAVAPLPAATAEAIAASVRAACRESFDGSARYAAVERMRGLAARLIGAASPDDVALVPNTSTGLATVARGLGLGAGDRVVITAAEYPANRYCWTDLKQDGVEVVEVPEGADLRVDPGRVADAITPGTSAVALSHVQFATGYRCDLRPVVKAAHRVGAAVCVDAIQSVGVLPVDVEALGVDFLVADGHKWMLGPEGVGILYARREVAKRMRPPIQGWMSVVRPTDYDAYRDGQWPENARRFEPGSWNVAAAAGLGASLSLLSEVGVDRVWERVRKLCDLAIGRLEGLGLRCVSPMGACEGVGERSGIVAFDLPEGAPTGGSSNAEALMRALRKQKVHVSARRGRLRISPHFYTPESDVDRLAVAMSDVLAEARA
ncbi:MAG: aminotransferase class V-fold PLP-dependent enzyme [Planctomycetota bacterium]